MSDRDSLDVDVLIVGGGPAGLAAALRLAQLQKAAGTALSIAVIEKAALALALEELVPFLISPGGRAGVLDLQVQHAIRP